MSTKKILSKIGTGLIAVTLSLGGLENKTLAAEEKFKPFYGLCYGPYREGQDPEWGQNPSIEQIREDLNMIKSFAYSIRTYGCDGILAQIPYECNLRGINCYPGAWIDNQSGDGNQITNLINIGKLNLSNVKGLVVGNESLYRNPSFESKQINYVNLVRNQTQAPTGCAEQWHIWRDYPNLANACDFLLVHVHPYWENQDVASAANFVLEKYNFIKSLYPNKQVIIGETGWPCAGAIRGVAIPSTNNQQRFISDFSAIVNNNTNNIKVMWFEFADEPWKAKYGTVEANWGNLDKNRNIKDGTLSYIKNNTYFANTDKNKISVRTFEKNSYELQACTNLVSPTWISITNYTSAFSTNETAISLSMTNKALFYRNVMKISNL